MMLSIFLSFSCSHLDSSCLSCKARPQLLSVGCLGLNRHRSPQCTLDAGPHRSSRPFSRLVAEKSAVSYHLPRQSQAWINGEGPHSIICIFGLRVLVAA